MSLSLKRSICLAAALVVAGASTSVMAQHDEHGGGAPAAHGEPHAEPHAEPHGPAGHPGEPHPGPTGYQRPEAPHGWDSRPKEFDRATYQHNFQAARAYHVGPYHRPAGWVSRRWAYGQTLPRGYWTSQYLLSDYWLFGLEVPPVNYEWVRVGDDAVLINTANGEILQSEYSVFG